MSSHNTDTVNCKYRAFISTQCSS